MADCELALRYFAIRDAIVAERTGSLRRILDRYMKDHAKDTLGQAEQVEQEFLEVLRCLLSLFNEKPFRLPRANRPSRPLYDALTVALSLETGYDPLPDKEVIQARLQQAISETETYEIFVGRGNTIGAVRERVDLARKILRGGDR